MGATNLAAAALLLWNILEHHGVDAAELFRKEGLAPEKMSEPNARFPVSRLEAAWNHAAALIPDPCFGLRGARAWHPSMLGALGFAWMSSSTLREAFGRWARYGCIVHSSHKLRLTQSDTGLEVCPEPLLGDTPPAAVDAWFAAIVAMCRMSVGDTLDPVAVCLCREQPPCAGDYEALFRCPVYFSSPENSFVLPLAAVDRPLASANTALAQLHDRVLAETMHGHDRSDFVAQVTRSLIDRLPSGPVTEARMAKILGLSQRTLQRKLSEEGTSFGQVFDSVRKELAMDYVSGSDISLIEISYLLGFSEASSFSRAFRRWTGRAPRTVRTEGVRSSGTVGVRSGSRALLG